MQHDPRGQPFEGYEGAAQRVGHFRAALKAPGGRLGQRPLQQAIEDRRHFGAHRTDQRRLDALLVGRDSLGQRLEGEGQFVGDEFVEDDAQRIKVGSAVKFAPFALFGGHVGRCAHRGPTLGQAGPLLQLYQAKVGQQSAEGLRAGFVGAAEALEDDIARLHVAMDDFAPVGIVESLGDLDADLQALDERQVFLQSLQAAQMVAQTAAVDVLHSDEQAQFGVAEVVDADDRGMIKLGGRARLLNQASAELVLAGKVAVHDLDGHLPLQIEIGGAIDRAHAAIAEQRV